MTYLVLHNTLNCSLLQHCNVLYATEAFNYNIATVQLHLLVAFIRHLQ